MKKSDDSPTRPTHPTIYYKEPQGGGRMNRITEIRHRMGMTQDQFAEFYNISRVSIARYDAGAPIGKKNAEKIAAACGIGIDEVLTRFIPSTTLSGPAFTINDGLILSDEERTMVLQFRNMNRRGQKRVMEYMEELKILYEK